MKQQRSLTRSLPLGQTLFESWSAPRMLGKIQHLRSRFHDAHFSKMAVLRDIVSEDGAKIGFLDVMEYSGGQLRLQGWVQNASLVTLKIGSLSRFAPPIRTRVDVSQALGIAPQIGFDITLPLSADQFINSPEAAIFFKPDAGGAPIPPLYIDFRPLGKAKMRTNLKFARALTGAVPTAFRWLAERTPQNRAKVLDQLGINSIESSALLDDGLFAAAPADADITQRITIVLPIYQAFDLLPEVLDRVQRHTDVPYHLILIEDASPDSRVRPFLREWIKSTDASVTLIENAENRGFIGSVNSGLDRAVQDELPDLPNGFSEGPVVLLNSDALVPAGWASRLITPLLQDATAASTTPMSNDAEIMSVPTQCLASDLAVGDGDALDLAAARFNPTAARTEVPTGVGFCMAMSRYWLDKVSQLDSAFGRGYGEEVDWCQKIRALGGHHLALGNVFVEHRGGASFGSEKQALVAHNNEIVSARYPHYDANVQTFIADDPLLSPRLALAIKWAARCTDGPVPVYLAHSLGGGAETYLDAKLGRDLNSTGSAIVLRVGGAHHWRIEVHTQTGMLQGDTDDVDLITDLIALLDARHIIYSCGVGAPDPVALPDVLLRLHNPKTDQLSVLVHDFYMVSPSYTLIGADGAYRGPNVADTTDAAHVYRTADGSSAPISEWQRSWHRLLAAANTIETFSQNSADILQDLWPELSAAIAVKPHAVPENIAAVTAPPVGAATSLGILGGINFAKGASVVERLAKENPDLNITIIGKVDMAYSMPPNVTIHGSYAPIDIPALAERYQINQWLIPSIWPETFSFTTHEALATGLPVAAFALGAQGDAVASAPNGTVLAFDIASPPDTGTLAASVLNHLSK